MKIIRRQGVSVCVLVGVSLCGAFTDTAALCACVLAPTLRQKKYSEISLARPTFESHFSEPAPASTTSHSVPEKRTLTQKLVVRRDRRDSVLCIFITRAIRKLPFHATHKREKRKGRGNRKKRDPIPSARCVLKTQAAQCTKDVFVFFRNALCKEVRLSHRGEPNSKIKTLEKILDNASAQWQKKVTITHVTRRFTSAYF